MNSPGETLEKEIGKLLRERGLTLAVAESCTGGLLGHRVTEVAGSSDYFLGGIISYSNEAKERLLGVRHETLLAHGAVSEETAREMAEGARRALDSDLALSITGIAGPGGGTDEKPVGLTYIALAHADGAVVERHVWPGDRSANKTHSAAAALRLLRSFLSGNGGDGGG
jgi:PncC family amidohydrolase